MTISKETTDQRKAGVWIDSLEAFIVVLNDGDPEVRTVSRDKEEHERILTTKNVGSRFGTGFISMEGKEQAKLDQSHSVYLKEVVKEIGTLDELVIFGPAQVKFELEKEISNTHGWKGTSIVVETADNMTPKQKVAWVLDHFK